MTTATIPKTRSQLAQLPPLESGDLLDQRTFHSRYQRTLKQTRAELIGGIVYMPSPLKPDHGLAHTELLGWLYLYKSATPGTAVPDNTTIILGKDSELQPDASMLVIGGQTRENQDGYLEGAPELVAEVASSSESYDLHVKKADYEKYGVREYLVVMLREPRVVW